MCLQECTFNVHEQRLKFNNCCIKAINQMGMVGVRLVNNFQIVMKWNRVFRRNECFPHPNPYIECNKTYQPRLFEFFPQIKIEITRWANDHLDLLSCENVGLEIRGKIIQKIYQSYLREANISSNELSMNEFLFEYGLKSVCNTTIWKWMKFLGFEYNEKIGRASCRERVC